MEELLTEVRQTLLDKGFSEQIKEELEGETAELLYSDGDEKHIYCRVYPEDHEWNQAIRETTLTNAQLQENFPSLAWATNGERNFYLDIDEQESIKEIPDVSEVETAAEKELDA
ncbi:MAG: hypothetical protein ACQEQD_10550, partial [Bacillota bacterium]